MGILQILGLAAAAVLALLLGLFVRRAVIARGGGTIELSLRLSERVYGRGWAPGLARFSGDELRWYRVFSFSVRPKRVFSRHGLIVESRREAEGPESRALPKGSAILRCTVRRERVEIAMTVGALTGFLSWLESAPPGAGSSHLAAR